MSDSKLPPANIEAEEAILGGILLDPGAMSRIEAQIYPQAFYLLAHQEIYQAILILYYQGKPTDLMAVSNYLADREKLEQIGGMSKLSHLLNRTVSAVNIDRYVDLVMDKFLRRKVIEAGHNVVNLGYDNTLELDTLLDLSQQEVFAISQQKIKSATEHNSEIAAAVFHQLKEHTPIYATGIPELDRLMVGFEPGNMTILAARPSMGKSAISLFMSLHISLNYQLPVVLFSLEMTKKQLEYRLWSLISLLDYYRHLSLTPIKSDQFRQYQGNFCSLPEKEVKNTASIADLAAQLPLYINDNLGISVASITSECRQIKAREGKLGLVVVDYLQLMAADSFGNRSYELGDVGRGLYQLARDLEVPILAISQVSRGVDNRNNKRPMMSDLSQSGILEMVADNIIFAYRDEYYARNTEKLGVLELILAKARHGSTGTAEVLFDKSSGLIRSFQDFA